MKGNDVLRVRDYLEHIELAMARTRRYLVSTDKASFLASDEKQDVVIRNIEIIGEAAQSIRRRHPEFAAHHPEIPWGGVYGMRNAIAHGYFTVDLDVVWKTVCEDLPALAEQVRALRGALQKDSRTAGWSPGMAMQPNSWRSMSRWARWSGRTVSTSHRSFFIRKLGPLAGPSR